MSYRDDDEKKKREEEAKNIISSINPQTSIDSSINFINYANDNNYKINVNNTNEQSFINRVNEANNIINSINTRENKPAPKVTEEESQKSRETAQSFINLVDKNLYKENKDEQKPLNVINDSNNSDNSIDMDKLKDLQKASSKNTVSESVNFSKNVLQNTKIGLASSSDVANLQEGSTLDIKAMQEAEEKNKNIEKGGLSKFEELVDTVLNNIYGGVKQTVSGLANVVTTAVGLGIRGLEGAAKIVGLQDIGNSLNDAYNKVVDTGSEISETANYERTVTSQVNDDLIKTAGDVTNVISNMVSSQVIGYVIPAGTPGVVIQGLSVGGSSAQEVLDENKDNIGQATLTGIAKGYTSYLTEKMFDANILTRGTKKTSVQEAVNRLISNKISSDFGKEVANRTVGIIGENLEELVEDNTDNLIDKLINNKDLPDFEEWWNNTTETAKTTTLSTIIMSMLGLGGTSFKEIEGDMNAQYWIDQAQQIIDQENLAIHFNPSEVKNINQTQDFYITRFTPEGEIANIVPTKGKTINNSKPELNVTPVVVLDSNTKMYNVIDGNTGVVLDSTPYTTTLQAEGGFNEKASNLSDLQVKDINNKISEANYMINNEILTIIEQAQEQLKQMTPADININTQTEQSETQYTKEQYDEITKTINQISDKTIYTTDNANRVFDTVSNNIENVNVIEQNGVKYINSLDSEGNVVYQQKLNNKVYTGKRIKEIINTAVKNADTSNIYQEANTNNTQTTPEPNASNFYYNETNYAVQDIKKVTEPFNRQESYTKEEMADVWNDEVSDNNYDAYYDKNGNIERYIAIEEDGNDIVVNQYDDNDNIVKSKVIPAENGRYNAETIKDTIERVSNLYDENRPIKGQRDIEGNEVLSMKKKIDNKKDTKITKKIEEYIAKNPNLRTDINISTDIIADINVREIKQMESYKIARDLFSKIHKRKFQNNNTDTNIYVTNSDIKESINTTYTYTEQRKYLKENIVIYSQLDKIIENAELISNTNELKGRQKYQQWEYYALPVNIDNNKFIIQFDTVKREDGETHFRVERLYKITDEGSSTTVVPTKKSATRFTVELPSVNNSIPQNTKSVKNNTAINKQSMQNEKNNTQDNIRSMKKNTSKSKSENNNSKNLIAQHNTSEEKLIEALDLGALPVPSIAITKSNTPVSNYGDITLLFNKDTINPTDKRNVAYNSDIYSTRKPQTVNSLDKNKVKAFEKFMNDKGVSYGYIGQIEEYIQDNDFNRAKDTIRYELQKVNSDVTEQEIEDSFTQAIETIKEKRILREDVDPYTPSGNRRTIEQMSIPYTLDNIVRLMTKKSNKGSESGAFVGLPEVRANMSKQFKTIEEMHQQEDNIISTEEMQKVKEQLNDEFYSLLDKIGKYDKTERYFGSADTIANVLNETAKAKNISKEVLENELDFVSITDVPDKVLQKAIDFLNGLRNIPTEYFEVKPQRAVDLSEIKSAIVPKNVSKEIVDRLIEHNIPIRYYEKAEQRNKLISEETNNKDIRFAKKTAKPKGEVIEPGSTNAQRDTNYIEQEIRKIEQSGNWDETIPVTKMTDIRKTIEDYLGIGVQKGHFRQQAYGIYKGNRDVIRTKELKDIDTILHETGHALDIGKRLKINKESISNELLKAINNYGGYETETREVQLEEGFAEVIREYAIVPEQARQDYPQTVAVLEGIRQADKSFDNFIKNVQQQTYNYIHQSPRNRGGLSNMSIGEQTDQRKWTAAKVQQEVMRNIYDKDWATKSAVNELQKVQGKTTKDLKASENAYYLTRLTSGIGGKITSMLSNGYIDENGNKLMPGLNQLGEILENNSERFNDLRAYLVAQRDLEYKARTLKTGIRTMDSKAIVEKFKNDTQIQEASKLVYDTLDGVMQYAVNNGLISQETADTLRKSNVFYVPMQRVLEDNKNNVGRRGAVKDVIRQRTGSELDIKDVLENVISNSANIIQQVENNNILKALYKQGEQAGITGKIYDVIDTPMVKLGTAKLSTWESELKNQGVDINNIDFDKTIDLFAPNNKVDSQHLITSFIDDNGKRIYLQFNDDVLFNSLMNMDKKMMSTILNINRKLNMPLRYGATMANIGFAIPNVISDTAQAAIFSEAGFIPVVDNLIGVMDIISAQNKGAREFFNKIIPGYADRINTLYAIYEQSGATSSTRMSQYRESTQVLMKDVYGTKNSDVLGIKEKYRPLKRLLDIMTYIPEISEQSTRFRIFEKNLEYYRRNGLEETDARIKAALQSRDATQDFGRTGNVTREINQLIPFSAARVGSAYTFAEKIKANPKRTIMRLSILTAIAMAIKGIGYDDDEIEELNQRKKNDNFVLKVGNEIVTIKKPQGILRSIINFTEYIQDLFTGHIEEGKEGEKLAELVQNAIMDNMPADSVTGLVPNMIAPVVENAINKDLYYNSDIVKSYDLELPDSEQYYDYNSQLAIWLGQIFNYSPAKIDNLISGYFAGLGTSITDIMDYALGKMGITSEQPEMGAEDNSVAKRFIVNVNSNSASVDEVYTLKTELTKKKNGGTITKEEEQQLEDITNATSEMAKLNKQIKEIKKDLTKSGEEKAEEIKKLQQQKTDTARKALDKDLLNSENEIAIESTVFYPSRDTLSQKGYTLNLTSEMKKEYEEIAYEKYQQYAKQGLYSEEKLENLKEKCKDYAKSQLLKKYRNDLIKSK